MKKVMALMLVLALCITLSACGKSEAAEMVDSLILSIGTVTLNSESAITTAEYAYAQLPDKDKEDVENLATLLKARTTYDGLMQQALQAAEETNQIIQQAHEKWEALDVSGTLEILDSITAMTVAQEEEINAFRAEIEESCYEGTHFLKLEHIIPTDANGYITYKGKEYLVSHDETVLDEQRTYHLYGFFGDGASSTWPDWPYRTYLINSGFFEEVSLKKNYPELCSEWAILGREPDMPAFVTVDDMGNLMAWANTSSTGSIDLEITILRMS